MGQIQQINPLQAEETISAERLQEDLNQLFTTINRLDKDNLYAPGGVFDFGGIFLDGLQKIQTNIGAAGSENRAVSKEYLAEQLDLKFDSDTGEWHKHDNKSILDDISDAGSGGIITTDERSRIASEDQKDAMDNANAPDSSNPFATMVDVSGSGDGHKANTLFLEHSGSDYTVNVPNLSGVNPRVSHIHIVGFINDYGGPDLDAFVETIFVWNSNYCWTRASVYSYLLPPPEPLIMSMRWEKVVLVGTSWVRVAPLIVDSRIHEYQFAKINDEQFKIKTRDNPSDTNMELAIMFYA